MDVCDDNEMPVTTVNELPETSADEMEDVQDRQIVNGESYASRAARTVSYKYPPRQQRAVLKMLCPSSQEPLFLPQART